ncbi:hypothetical protein EFW17_20840 [Halostreptopolyspora alba]|uniref:Uncharacterized protein n=2 Tax=Halostreptopolyspora alba TaxID=2487137 RepID=A0A3N0E2N9_9ACTN|nr:hypothetical protein EFW17_20840 [Nocardiopsaceae bacterium YIM 96095]
MGAVLMGAPAYAHGGGADEQSNQNTQLVPVQLCNTNVALLGANSSEARDCINGPQQGNVD